MKKFILSLVLAVCGVFILCSSVIGEAIVECGMNVDGLRVTLFSVNDSAFASALFCVGAVIAIAGFIMSVIFSKENKR